MSNTALATNDQSQAVEQFSAFGSITHFESAQRMAKALSSSSIVPETYRGDGKLGDCIIALEIANRIGATVLAVMQNLYIVHGRPAWSSQFLISCVNASRKFSPLRYKMTGTKGQDDWGCIAWATDRTGEVLESPEITIGMAKAEGWYARNGSKWKTLPELMLRYRTATLFTRLFCPELTMGIKTDDEVIDIESSVVAEPVKSAAVLFSKPAAIAASVEVAAVEKPVAAQPVAEETARQFIVRMLTDANVPLDMFVADVAARNIAKDADSWASYDDAPEAVFEALKAQPKTMATIIKKFGNQKS